MTELKVIKITLFIKVFLTTFLILLLTASAVYAAQTKPKAPSEATMSEAELNGYTEEAWAALKDNKLEYDEINELIHNFNPTMAEYWDAFDDSVRSVQESAQIMREAKKEATDNYDKYKSIPGMPATTLAQLKSMVTLTSTMVSQYSSTYDKLKKGGSSTKQLTAAEDQLTKAVQQMMIGYKTVESNVSILKKLVELNEASVKAYTDMKESGMATETDVLKAKADLISAQSSLASLEGTRKKLYATLLTMCGWDADDSVIIGEIPDTAEADIDAMDPATDFTKAAGNNTTLISLRDADRKGSDGAIRAQDTYYTSMEDRLKVVLDTLYAEAEGADYAYEAAKAGYEGAKIQKEAVKKQLESGMLSEAQYIGSEIQVLQKEAALETARNNLKQAVEDYRWAVKGYCDI